ncbi:MMPL family transporter [Agromyces sp. Marseille-P2726]|uniref:MMPL family transporter n=1 Tax=Agromyces sp. Marseille-P2726 TaxID=2709132 RepID=UPI00156DF5C5|nr:MMPL family transporter [Agromyces sp. Marseille-P2726]
METTAASSTGRVPTWLRVLIPAVLILVWFAAFGAGGASFGRISEVSTNDQAQFLPSSAEATEVNELQEDFRGSDAIPATVVVAAGDGELDESQLDDIEQLRDRMLEVPGVLAEDASPALPSDDGVAVQLFVPIDASDGAAPPTDVVGELRAVADDHPVTDATVAVTGPAGFTADLAGAFSGIDGLLLAVALTAVFIILVIVYRSPLLPLLVLFTSMSALCAAVFTVTVLAAAEVLLLSGQTQGILFILVIGAATDYALLYIARYRESLGRHDRKWDATWAAIRGAWEPIVASGGTVIVGLLILLASQLVSNQTLGPVAAIGIVFAILAALTLLPALLLWAGRAAFWPRRIKPAHAPEHARNTARETSSEVSAADAAASGDGHHRAEEKGVWAATGRLVSRRPRIVWIVSVVALGVMSLGLLQLDADGVPSSEFVLGESEARDGQELLGEHFPAGSGSPAVIIGPEAALQDMADIALGTSGVASLTAIADTEAGTAPVTEGGIQAFGPPGTPAPEPVIVDGRVMLQATLDAPADSEEAEAIVVDLRESLDEVGTDVLVGGESAVAYDTQRAAIADRTLIIPLVLAAILLILMLLLRSIVAPLLLIGTVVLSFAAALGVSALVFEHVLRFPGADPSVPLFGFVFLVALGVDYNIFLMTRVREESLGYGTRPGIIRGLRLTGGVITSAGLVLAATFAALGVLPILFLAQLAFIVAFGVLLDTFLVRTLLVPALAYDIGPAVWWPSRLSRRGHASKTSGAVPPAEAADADLVRR